VQVHRRDLDGHVAIVTGANHGIGAATARTLADAGAGVVVTGLRMSPTVDDAVPAAYAANRARPAANVAAEIRAGGGRAVAVEADLRDPEAPALLFDRAEADLGPVDILVNNASGWSQDSFGASPRDPHGRVTGTVTADSIDGNYLVDARAAALLIAEFAARHRARAGSWGRIVGVTSGGPEGFPTEVSYGAAKAAQENYTMSAAAELGDEGITANVVYPPVTDTGWVTDDVREFVRTSAGHFHVAAPADVAAVVCWLCSAEAWLVSGSIIRLR